MNETLAGGWRFDPVLGELQDLHPTWDWKTVAGHTDYYVGEKEGGYVVVFLSGPPSSCEWLVRNNYETYKALEDWESGG
jgi:hypothetical protein